MSRLEINNLLAVEKVIGRITRLKVIASWRSEGSVES